MNQQPPLTVLGVLDGFGYSGQEYGNAILQAQTPNLDYLWSNYPSYLLKAAEEEVGLEFGEIGNSEVGHMTIGSGRVIPQSLNRINRSISDGSFQQIPAFVETMQHVKANNSRLHLLGIISSSGVHGHLGHYLELIRLAARNGVQQLFLHLILDGRDAGKFDSPLFLNEIDKVKTATGVGTYATLVGRAYAMDRNENWDKTAAAYNLLLGKAEHVFPDPGTAIQHFYDQKIDDENIPPTLLTTTPEDYKLKENDAIIFSNFREDRARQLTFALTEQNFSKFNRIEYPENLLVTTMTRYKKGMNTKVAFPPPIVPNTLSDVLSQNRLSQIHIAETEKYGHMTYFFNGGREEKANLEEFYLIDSVNPDQFASNPQMSAPQITEAVLQSINLGYNFIVFNFANCDMVGHTGNYQSTIQAIQVIDSLLKQIYEAVWAKNGYFLLTADHGNSEQMVDPKTQEIYKKHTIAPVPFIISHPELLEQKPTEKVMSGGQISGLLSDVAPTVLQIMGLSQPDEMTGASLI